MRAPGRVVERVLRRSLFRQLGICVALFHCQLHPAHRRARIAKQVPRGVRCRTSLDHLRVGIPYRLNGTRPPRDEPGQRGIALGQGLRLPRLPGDRCDALSLCLGRLRLRPDGGCQVLQPRLHSLAAQAQQDIQLVASHISPAAARRAGRRSWRRGCCAPACPGAAAPQSAGRAPPLRRPPDRCLPDRPPDVQGPPYRPRSRG